MSFWFYCKKGQNFLVIQLQLLLTFLNFNIQILIQNIADHKIHA